jgi:DMSO/TMAO reductase YedYZ molybdopterin-dependent catalytic subunit
VRWEGIRPETIIDLVQPMASAKFVTLQSLETPYVDQVSLDQFREPDAMLARHQDGKPLTRSHGAPLRLVLPSMYGYKNVKWVRELRFDAAPAPGYWEQRGYDVDAWVGKSNGYDQ